MEFARLVRHGRLAEALGLWRGTACEDVREHSPVATEARRLDEERLGVEVMRPCRVSCRPTPPVSSDAAIATTKRSRSTISPTPHPAVGNTGQAREAPRSALAILTELDHPDAEGIRSKLDGR
ncbi:BTAD domain-containing putative transcriptional regulator [Allorhizocola rhizosphaerae]|uniref:BTAD domain-containing putative transcriptional regulator n=1 Tax=Allorhizocola rhizosphaerae TaxID=1872709 RepID=UPI0013C378FB|nr:BTAD domain-containing putative transcriptional regulator [Allorhizocola rhizosphaerae]